MAKKFYNLARMYTTTTGDSDITVTTAVPGCKTFEQAGFSDSDELNYGIITYDLTTHRPVGAEVGLGKYLSSDSDGGPYIQRTTVYASISQDSDDTEDANITLTGLSEVYCPWLVEDILRVRESDSDPSVYPVKEIIVPNGSLTDNGNGTVTVDFSADSDVVTLTGTQTLTNKTLTTPILTIPTLDTPVFTGTAASWPDNVRQTFNPGANSAGVNVGAHTADPATPVNGDLWYNSTDNELNARINGSTVALGAGGGGDVYDSDVIMQDITTNNADSDAHGFLLKLSMNTSHYLRADGSWQAPPAGGTVYDSDVVFSDTTANNADSDAHGYLPKLSMDSTEFMSGTGEWLTPPGTGGGLTNSNISPTTSNVSAAAGTRYFADVSGMTADRNFILPTCSAGDEIELKITVGDDTYELIVIGDTGVSIEGGSAATEWSRLFISGETVHFVASGTDAWRVTHDGRIPCVGRLSLSAADTTNSAGTDTTPTWDTAEINRGNVCDLTNYRFNIRRAGYYRVSGNYRPNSSLTDQKYSWIRVYQNAGLVAMSSSRQSNAGSVVASAPPLPGETFLAAVGDYFLYQYATEDANMGIANHQQSYFQIEEV